MVMPAQSSAIGVALVGAGNLARWAHLPNLKKTPGVRLRAIHSSSGARGKSYARRFGADYCASDYAEILKDPEIQAVVIVSRNQQHAAQALAASACGQARFCRKADGTHARGMPRIISSGGRDGKAAYRGIQPPLRADLS